MKYRDYTASDFANDSFFIRWVRNPDEESDWFWTCFIKEHPARAAAIAEARELISALHFPKHALDEDAHQSMRNNLLMALRAEKEERKEKPYVMARHRLFATESLWVRAAAAVILVPLLSWAALHIANGRGNMLSSAIHTDQRAVDYVANDYVANANFEKTVVFLHDGTKVWLNAGSKLRYPKDFEKQSTRDVYLEGEAFFDVARNAGKAFIVHTSSIKIKVMGTSFNVKSYKTEKTVETTLVEGKVRIEQSDVTGTRIGDVELKPNQLAVFDKVSKVINIREIPGEKSGAWKEEKLVFDAQAMDYAILQLEKWYGVNIHTENKGSLNCRLTASIERETLEEVLQLIEASHHVTYRIEGSDVFIDGSLCEGAPREKRRFDNPG